MPTATSCDADGNGLISIGKFAAFHGTKFEEVHQNINAIKSVLPDGSMDEYIGPSFVLN